MLLAVATLCRAELRDALQQSSPLMLHAAAASHQVYDRLNVELTECGESFYNKMIPGTLDEMDKAGILKVYTLLYSSILYIYIILLAVYLYGVL
jgi:tRNA synthetases class I (R)